MDDPEKEPDTPARWPWIRTWDALPEPGETVIVCSASTYPTVWVEVYDPEKTRGPGWCHWMPFVNPWKELDVGPLEARSS